MVTIRRPATEDWQLPLSHFQHPVKSHARPALDAGADLDAVDDAALDQVFKHPGQVVGADAVHGGAEASGVVQGDDALALGGKRRAMRLTR